VKLPAGPDRLAGNENQQRASARLALVLPISLAMIFVVLYATLRSVRASLLILVNIPSRWSAG
jgi:cobalt-zinc-cadmium resistance protein CzcA